MTHSNDERRLEQLYTQAFDRMRSTTSTQDLVRTARMATNQEEQTMLSKGQRKMTRRAFVGIAACATVLTAGAAIAATQKDFQNFLETAFGSKGHADSEAVEVLEPGSTIPWTQPSRQWTDVDAETAERLVGGYTEEVGQSVSIDLGATLTVESCVVDQNGMGVATFVLESDEDMGLEFDEHFGEVWGGKVAVNVVDGATMSSFYDCRSIYYADSSTANRVEAVLYFGPFDPSTEGGLDSFVLLLRDTSSRTGIAGAGKIEYTPSSAVPAQTFATADGTWTVSLSPLGIVIDGGETEYGGWGNMSITFGDGSTYIARDSDVYNVIIEWLRDDDTTAYMFNRLVDVDDVTSIEITRPNADGSETTFVFERVDE